MQHNGHMCIALHLAHCDGTPVGNNNEGVLQLGGILISSTRSDIDELRAFAREFHRIADEINTKLSRNVPPPDVLEGIVDGMEA